MEISADTTVAVVGLGYVGLPLAIELGKRYRTIGYDLSEAKVESYRKLVDPTGEIGSAEFKLASRLTVTTDPAAMCKADVILVAVPTPIGEGHIPDFGPLMGASATVGKYMKRGAIVVYESTVYPGATEDICLPLLEQNSGMRWKEDFHIGYSPERVSPGDKARTLTKIVKVVSADDDATLGTLRELYGSVITAGIHCASSIKVAEAAKVIENTQRDLNIALMNELAIIFDKMGISTSEVLEAAGTKWNFLKFKPGLVGGHCIGVDPYYLTYKAEMLGYHPQVILAGRRINDSMPNYIAQQTIKLLIKSGSYVKGAKVGVLGLTFKENCPDLRNSKAAELVRELQEYGCEVCVHDPLASAEEALKEYGIVLSSFHDLAGSDAIVAAVAHEQYLSMSMGDVVGLVKPEGSFVDVKSVYKVDSEEFPGVSYWTL